MLVALWLGVSCGDIVDDQDLFEEKPGSPDSGPPPVPTCEPPCTEDMPVCCDIGSGLSCHMYVQGCPCLPDDPDRLCEGVYPLCCDTGDGKGLVCRSLTVTAECR